MKRQQPTSEPSGPQPLRQGGATSVEEQAAAKLIAGYPLPRADDLTVQRIWHRVARATELGAPAQRSRWVGVLASGMTLCLAVALGVVILRGRAGPSPHVTPTVMPAVAAELAAARGGVFFSRPAERWQPGDTGQALAEGQLLRTDPSGQAVMDIPGVASILISRGTDLAIERLGGGTFLRLSQGSVVARVSKRPPSEPFFILTHRFSVQVVGTLFQVDQDASDHTAVSVREGVVEVTEANGRSWRVRAGQSWSSGSPEQLGTSAIPDTVKTLLEDGLNRASPTELDRELGAVDGNAVSAGLNAGAGLRGPPSPPFPSLRVGEEGGGAGLRAGGTGSPGGAGRLSKEESPLPSAGPAGALALVRRTHLPSRASAPPPVLLAAREPAPAPAPAPSFEPIPAPAPSAPPSAARAAGDSPSSAGTYADGVALERAGKIQAAAENFIQAEKGDPVHADLALYALGRLRQHRLRDPRGALEAFETYRRTYPRGPLLPEVDLAVLEVEVAAGHRDRALAESVRFLASHPASERTVEVHLLRGDLLRERGDCGSALGEYQQVDAAAFAEDALFETAYCQRKLGDTAASRDSLRQYRQRYPNGTHRDEVAKALRE